MMRHFRNWQIGFIALLFIAALPFLRCWNYDIINLDDYRYLTLYLPVREWSGWRSVAHAFTNVDEAIWMPLTWLSYSFDWLVFGDWFGGFHLHSIVVHAANSILVFCLIRIVFSPLVEERRDVPITAFAFLGALIWAVHPLRCESVVFLSSRKDVLSFFWEFLALICWCKGSITHRNRFTVLAVCFFVVGSMCKPSVMTFPILCLLVDIFAFREVRLFRYAIPVAYMAFLGPFAAWQQTQGGAVGDIFHQPLWGRILGAAAAFGIYLKNTLWPLSLAPQCIKTWPAWPRFWLPGLIISTLWALYLLRRLQGYWDDRKTMNVVRKSDIPIVLTFDFRPNFCFLGMAWFAIAVAPMLGVASFGYHAFADRFTYIPAVGLSILAVWALARFWRQIGRTAFLIGSSMVVLALSCCTWRQTGYWKDDLTLFTHTLEVDGNQNTNAHCILANWYFEFAHDLDKCVEHFDIAASQNFTFVYPCVWVYVLALSETQNEDKIADVVRRYESETEKDHGPERARAIWAGADDLKPNELAIRSMYHACKVCWWLADGDRSLDNVKETFDSVSGDNFNKDSLWLYLQWKYHKAKGNQKEADQKYAELIKSTNRIGYTRFRYLRQAKRGGDSGEASAN